MFNKGLILLAAFIFLICSTSAQAKPKVLVIESYHAEYQWDINYEKGLESILKDVADIYYFRMDTKRIKTELHEERAALAWQAYTTLMPDVVVLADDNAIKFLGSKFIETETPVVYLGINNNPRNYIPLNKNITGVLERPLYKRSVKYLKKILHIEQGKILVLLDTGTTSKVLCDSVFEGCKSLRIGDVQVDIELVGSFNDWKDIVNRSDEKGYSAIILGLFHTLHERGKSVSSPDIMAWTYENTPVPLFCFWEMDVGKNKTIGGLVLSGEVQGSTAGEIVLDILNGVPVNKIKPIIPTQGLFLFSSSELKKWRIVLPRQIRDKATFVE
ncbi:ABC transporter substrate-binding protein [Maridesulfovibrio ferrireducens]|uniref:ABC transporter substrate-binding protein n=1 Tax=Maridesulfovibrio ferrireducens TaxID=246191 RepID=UPI001A1BDFC5|nr:hypothetical protein [Maridesulfovibrio ferrireducens]MBI9110204.1 hypothetical protein [Maridesulfovibrio ferrireducens]